MPPRVFRVPFFVTGLVLALAPATTFAATPERSVSVSRQFIVYGSDVAMRGAICDLAERAKRDLLTVLHQRDAWTSPIVINAQYLQANLPELPRLRISVGQTGFGLKFQLDLVVDPKISLSEVQRELLRALLLEMMYRAESNIPAGAIYASPPDWLLDGMPAQQSDMPRDGITNVLALPVAAGTVLPLEKFLQQRPELLDAPGRLLYRAYSFALVDLLTHTREGSHRLARFILDLPSAPNDLMADLRIHFPEVLERDGGAEKIWEKQIARLSTEQPYQLMGSAETERILDEKLRLKISDRGGRKVCQLVEFPNFVQQRSAKNMLAFLTLDLRALAIRANPIYAPIIAGYAEVTELLGRGKTKGISKRLERLQASRKAVAAQMRGIDDYLSWFEATSLPRRSGAFADYMKAAESAAQPRLPKHDPISVYLDVLEAQFEN